MTPKQRYQSDLTQADFSYDPAQERAVDLLQDLYERLLAAESPKQNGSWVKRLFAGLQGDQPKQPVKGLYFWGGVGRGKTYLMDAFYDSLPFEQKMRAHFHRFMQRVHNELKASAGKKNPLTSIAEQLASEARVICFDEFFVSDITDAMILGSLFEQLFANGVTLVATSNIVPDGLYKNGLQRARFLPAIALINQHTEVVNVDGGIDYRLRALEQAELYHYPLGAEADASLAKSFASLNPDVEHVLHNESLQVEGARLLLVVFPMMWCGLILKSFVMARAVKMIILSWHVSFMPC